MSAQDILNEILGQVKPGLGKKPDEEEDRVNSIFSDIMNRSGVQSGQLKYQEPIVPKPQTSFSTQNYFKPTRKLTGTQPDAFTFSKNADSILKNTLDTIGVQTTTPATEANWKSWIEPIKYLGTSFKGFGKTDIPKSAADLAYAFYDTLDVEPTTQFQKPDLSLPSSPTKAINLDKFKQSWNNWKAVGENVRYYTLGQIFKGTKADEEIAQSMLELSDFLGKEKQTEVTKLGLAEMSSLDPRKIAYNFELSN